MTYITGHDRSQMLLLPEAVDDYVGSDNPVRFIDAFVDGLDLAAAGFGRIAPKVTGRPAYAPADLLKLYIYGYLNRVRSSRRLETETHRNIEVIWLLRHLKPDFKTIADFRRDNRNAFRQGFREFVLLCANWTCLAGNCWRWMARGSRRSTTRSSVALPLIRSPTGWREASVYNTSEADQSIHRVRNPSRPADSQRMLVLVDCPRGHFRAITSHGHNPPWIGSTGGKDRTGLCRLDQR